MGLLMFNGVPYSGFTEPSSIYTTEEREVGVWIDGKPLYEITLSYHESSPVASKTYDITSLGIEFVLLGEKKLHFGPNGGNGWADVPWFESNSYQATIRVAPTQLYAEAQGWLFVDVVATIYYTKTSDVPGSGKYAPDGSVMHHYSTDEHIIGTWINGKTLYEKTIYYTSSAGQSDSDKIIDNTILHGVNCNVVDVQGTQSYGYMNDQMPNNTSDPEPLSQSSLYLPYYGGGNIASAHIYFYSDGIHFIKRCAASEANSIILTVKYVKKSS